MDSNPFFSTICQGMEYIEVVYLAIHYIKN